ncbi:hypothetical protein V8F33_007481 [Rhypophila sp. PSN 637]
MDAKNESGAMSVDNDMQPLNYQSVDSWLQRVGVAPSTSSAKPAALHNKVQWMPAADHSLELHTTPANNDMIPVQFFAKMDRLNKKVNDLESTIYFLKEEISELHQKKTQLNQELAGLSNAKSAIKTINQRLNSIQFGFSRLLDRIEVLEKSTGIEDAFRSAKGGHSIEFTNGNEEILSNPANPLTVLTSGAIPRGRGRTHKNKRRAVDQGDRPVATAAPAFNIGTAAAAVANSSPADIAKMEELVAIVVRQLEAMKLQRAAEGGGPDDGRSTTTGPPTTGTTSSMDGDIPMSNEEGTQGQEGGMGGPSFQLPNIPSYAPPSSSPIIPYPKPQFPLQTATKQRPSLQLITGAPSNRPAMAPKLGALGVTFVAMRVIQFVAFVTIVGMTANFVNHINTSDRDPPGELVGTLVVATAGIVYVVITSILYWDEILPNLVSAGLDTLILIAAIVVAVLLGRPLSKTNCDALSFSSNSTVALGSGLNGTSGPAASSNTFATTDYSSYQRRDHGLNHTEPLNKTLSYLNFIITDKSTCYQLKAVWGLATAMAVTFAFSVLVCVGLWYRVRRETRPDGGVKEVDAEAAATKNVDASSDSGEDDGGYRFRLGQNYH